MWIFPNTKTEIKCQHLIRCCIIFTETGNKAWKPSGSCYPQCTLAITKQTDKRSNVSLTTRDNKTKCIYVC